MWCVAHPERAITRCQRKRMEEHHIHHAHHTIHNVRAQQALSSSHTIMMPGGILFIYINDGLSFVFGFEVSCYRGSSMINRFMHRRMSYQMSFPCYARCVYNVHTAQLRTHTHIMNAHTHIRVFNAHTRETGTKRHGRRLGRIFQLMKGNTLMKDTRTVVVMCARCAITITKHVTARARPATNKAL